MANKMKCINEIEYERLYKLDGRVDALMSYINTIQKKETSVSYIEIDTVKAIIGMLDD